MPIAPTINRIKNKIIFILFHQWHQQKKIGFSYRNFFFVRYKHCRSTFRNGRFLFLFGFKFRKSITHTPVSHLKLTTTTTNLSSSEQRMEVYLFFCLFVEMTKWKNVCITEHQPTNNRQTVFFVEKKFIFIISIIMVMIIIIIIR